MPGSSSIEMSQLIGLMVRKNIVCQFETQQLLFSNRPFKMYIENSKKKSAKIVSLCFPGLSDMHHLAHRLYVFIGPEKVCSKLLLRLFF